MIARGAPHELKQQTGGPVLEVRPADPADVDAAASQLAPPADGLPEVDRDTGMVRVSVEDAGLLAVAVRRLDDAGITVADLALRRPSLDEVFLHLTGRRAQPADSAESQPVSKRRTRRRAA